MGQGTEKIATQVSALLNEMLGVPPFVAAALRSDGNELPEDDEPISDEEV